MKRLNETLETLYEYDHDFFSYTQMARERWCELIRDAMKKFKVHFDLENNDTVKQQREIVIPQKEWEFSKCKFRCELFSAGGDWQVPAYYFRCQLVDGYAFEVEKYRNSGLFVFIPGKTEGNFHLTRSSNGEDWSAPDNNNWKKGIDPERNDRKCWETLEKYLKVLVDLKIEKTRSERIHEGLFTKPEKPEIKSLREKKEDIYLFHGTNLRKRLKIEKEGLKPSKAEDYYKGMEEFQPGGSLFGKDVIWLTSYEKYAKLFSTRSKTWILDLKRYEPLIIKVNGSKLRFLDNTGSEDEYVTEYEIRPKNIIWSDSLEYEEVKKKKRYLT